MSRKKIFSKDHTEFSASKFLSSGHLAVGPASPFAPTLNNNLLVVSLKAPRTDEFGQPATTERITYSPLRRLKFFLID